jgi:hypothetical protein
MKQIMLKYLQDCRPGINYVTINHEIHRSNTGPQINIAIVGRFNELISNLSIFLERTAQITTDYIFKNKIQSEQINNIAVHLPGFSEIIKSNLRKLILLEIEKRKVLLNLTSRIGSDIPYEIKQTNREASQEPNRTELLFEMQSIPQMRG